MGYYGGNFASVMQTTNLALKPILIGGTPEQVQYFSSTSWRARATLRSL